jgi:hypothetical protein
MWRIAENDHFFGMAGPRMTMKEWAHGDLTYAPGSEIKLSTQGYHEGCHNYTW